MGTTTRHENMTGKDVQSAFRSLQESDREEYGDDVYNGRWNNCQGVREVSTSVFDKAVREGDNSKHQPAVAKCIRKPVKNNNAIKTQVENFPNKGTRKWVTKYVAYQGYFGHDTSSVGIIESSQAVAIKKARTYVSKHPNASLTIRIEKVLEKQDTKVAKITYKPAKNEADGEWEIYGGMPD